MASRVRRAQAVRRQTASETWRSTAVLRSTRRPHPPVTLAVAPPDRQAPEVTLQARQLAAPPITAPSRAARLATRAMLEQPLTARTALVRGRADRLVLATALRAVRMAAAAACAARAR